MYVCLCNGYRCDDIREVAREGAVTVRDAYEMLGDGLVCGRCEPTAQAILETEGQAGRSAVAQLKQETRLPERVLEKV